MRLVLLSLFLSRLACFPAQLRAQSSGAGADLGGFFPGVDATFVLLDGQTGRTVRHNPERARTRFLPASTFKIPNSLIALETGVASGPDFALPWDSVRVPRQPWWPAAWARGHTLRTALPNSVVWYYQELARRIGAERMRGFLLRFEYGNGDLDRGRRVAATKQVLRALGVLPSGGA
jgi:beta-lactamase class D